MTPSEVNYIRYVIATEGKRFRYHKDQYPLDLLTLYLKHPQHISQVRKSPLGHFLQKPTVKKILASQGHAQLKAETFMDHADEKTRDFNYTIGTWGRYEKHFNNPYYQTSRGGVNLVLQLNFDPVHNSQYFRYVQPHQAKHPFVCCDHPTRKYGDFTMAWARIDVDLEEGEALIEEVQTDWLRYAKHASEKVRTGMKNNEVHSDVKLGFGSMKNFLIYAEQCLSVYYQLWDEAVLDAALVFLVKELGCRRIYYHSYETGCCLKGLSEAEKRPPKSLYTRLPKKFGFRETDEAPYLLKKEKSLQPLLRDHSLRWYTLNF